MWVDAHATRFANVLAVPLGIRSSSSDSVGSNRSAKALQSSGCVISRPSVECEERPHQGLKVGIGTAGVYGPRPRKLPAERLSRYVQARVTDEQWNWLEYRAVEFHEGDLSKAIRECLSAGLRAPSRS
jgi:hypothetical protein